MTRGRPSRQSIYDRLEEAIAELRERMGGLPSPAEAEDIWDDLWHREAHHSTALEGNTLVLNQVRKLLDEGRAVGAKELREYMEVVGYGEAARWVYGQALDPGDWTNGKLLTPIKPNRTVDPGSDAPGTSTTSSMFTAIADAKNAQPNPHRAIARSRTVTIAATRRGSEIKLRPRTESYRAPSKPGVREVTFRTC